MSSEFNEKNYSSKMDKTILDAIMTFIDNLLKSSMRSNSNKNSYKEEEFYYYCNKFIQIAINEEFYNKLHCMLHYKFYNEHFWRRHITIKYSEFFSDEHWLVAGYNCYSIFKPSY